MNLIFKNFIGIVHDLKTYLKIKLKYKKLYPNSVIESFIFPETIIGDKVVVKKRCTINSGLLKIGKGTYIGSDTKIFECKSIGNFCSISHDVRIGLSNHPLNFISTNPLFYDKSRGLVSKTTYLEKEKNKTIIEHDVLISANVLIMSGITIGTGSVIGAGSFVNKDVPPYSIVVGTPAKIIDYRFDKKTREKLMSSTWWNLSFLELKDKEKFFQNPLKFIDEK